MIHICTYFIYLFIYIFIILTIVIINIVVITFMYVLLLLYVYTYVMYIFITMYSLMSFFRSIWPFDIGTAKRHRQVRVLARDLKPPGVTLGVMGQAFGGCEDVLMSKPWLIHRGFPPKSPFL